VRRAHTVWLASTLSASLYPTGGTVIAPIAGTRGIAAITGTKVLVQGGSHLALHALDLTSAAGVLNAVLLRRRRTVAVADTRHSAHTPSTCVNLPAVCAQDLVAPYSVCAGGGWRGRRKRNKKALAAGAALPVPLALTALQGGKQEETGMQGRGQAQGVEGADERPGVQERDAAWYASRRHKAHRQVARELQTIWAQVLCLDVREVELNVPFIEYGGDSLTAIEVLSLAAASNVALADAASLTANFEMLSIQDLVSKAVGSHAAAACPLSSAAAAVPTLSLSLSEGGAGGGGGGGEGTVIWERNRNGGTGTAASKSGGLSACARGDLTHARALSSNGWHASEMVDKHGNTALMWAAGAGHLDVVQVFASLVRYSEN